MGCVAFHTSNIRGTNPRTKKIKKIKKIKYFKYILRYTFNNVILIMLVNRKEQGTMTKKELKTKVLKFLENPRNERRHTLTDLLTLFKCTNEIIKNGSSTFIQEEVKKIFNALGVKTTPDGIGYKATL